MSHVPYSFYDRPQYFKSLTDELHGMRSGDMVTLATMSFDVREPLVAKLTASLTDAARRGADVWLAIDAYTFLDSDTPRPGPFWSAPGRLGPDIRPPYNQQYAALESLRTAGGHYTITNTPQYRFSLPVAGRSHIKAAVIRSRGISRTWLGGHNLDDSQELDIMACFSDETMAKTMQDLVRGYIHTGNVRASLASIDQQYAIGPGTDIFVDAGVPHQSRILDEAVALVDAARQHVFMTCQFFPGGRIGRSLARAQRRGVEVTLVYSHPSVHGWKQPLQHINETVSRMGMPADFFSHRLPKGTPNLHAKLLATDGGAMLGSHNYVDQGVALGTAEVAVRLSSPDFTAAAQQAIMSQLPNTIVAGLPQRYQLPRS